MQRTILIFDTFECLNSLNCFNAEAKRVLKNLRVKASPTNTEYKITGLSAKICKELMFWMKHSDEKGEPRMTEITVYDYFVNIRNIPLLFSGDLPCVNVGKPKRPTYIPLEVASSRCCPLISKYRVSFHTQSPKVEMIDSLFKNVAANKDVGIMREILLDFYISSEQRKPDQIIIFRDGVCESQFNQVLNVELNQIIMACKFLDEKWCPKFVIIITQKKHHTKFFLPTSTDNVPPGTVIDNGIGHPRNNDFYLCTQTGMIGTIRPSHYHVLLDEVGFSPDDLQEFVHSLSYGCQGSMTAISVVAPVHYTHLAATQMQQFMNIDDMPETSSIMCIY